jgi:hypothetical protein
MIKQLCINFIKGTTMKTHKIFWSILLAFVLTLPAIAGGNGDLQKYFNDAAKKVKAAENAAEKRDILNESFQSMANALNQVQNSGMISKDESNGIDLFKAALQEKQDELAGRNGYERVPDAQLNAFSNYVVQDMEQASITISLVALVLIIILLVLIL